MKMNDGKLAMARLALGQLNRKDRVTLARELGLVDDATGTTATPIDIRLLRRHEVARRLSVSPRTVDNWAREGLLTKKRLPGRKRACGFSSVEVDKLITHGVSQE